MNSLFEAYEDWAADRIVLKASFPDGTKHGASMHFDMRAEAARTLGLALLNAVAKFDNLNAGLVQPEETKQEELEEGDKIWRTAHGGYEIGIRGSKDETRRKFKKGDKVRFKEGPNAVYMEGIAQEDEWDNGYVKLKTPQYTDITHQGVLELVVEERIAFKEGDRVIDNKNRTGTVFNWNNIKGYDLTKHPCKDCVPVRYDDVVYEGETRHITPEKQLRKFVLVPLPEFLRTRSLLGSLVWFCDEKKVGVVDGISPFRPNEVDVVCNGVLIPSLISNLMGIQ